MTHTLGIKILTYKILVVSLLFVGCNKAFLKYDDAEKLIVDDGIPDVQIKDLGDDPNANTFESGVILDSPDSKAFDPPHLDKEISVELNLVQSKKSKKNNKEKRSSKKSKLNNNLNDTLTSSEQGLKGKNTKRKPINREREPKYESNVGFENGSRQPIKNPFRIGEKVVLSVRYFKAQAGELTLEVKPLVEVNGRKAYRWFTGLKTTGMFSRFYTIDDWAETLVDFETLVPSVFELQVKESAQLKNGKGYFDTNTLKAVYVEKKYTEKKGHQEKHQKWDLVPYAQNVFSAAFYMRVFTYEVGKEYKFTVSDDEKNMTFKGKALRKEKIETEAGIFDAIVVKPEFEVDGVFKPVGDIFFWLTDDDRKLIVHIESEIKIGTLVMDAISVDKGND